MRSSWPARVLLPAVQALAEGSWLALLYAALQAASQEVAYLGPLELGALVMAGSAWGRRRRWTSPRADAVGLILLALLCGAFGWLLAQPVRLALSEGDLLRALSLHVPGWLAAIAFWRGDARSRGDDAGTEHWLARWAVPGLAVPWLLGYAFVEGRLQEDFTAAALIATLFFAGSAFAALGLRRLEALRVSTGRDWRGDRSWLFMIIGLSLVLTIGSVPLAALLGIPARSLLGAVVGPLQTLVLLLVLLTAPAFLAAALVAGWLSAVLPAQPFKLPTFTLPHGEASSDLLLLILSVVVAAIFVFDFLGLVVLLWLLYRGRRSRDPFDQPFEERAIVAPDEDEGNADPEPLAPRRRAWVPDDVTAAYLAALEALATDGRWPRRADESPAAHLARARAEGLRSGAFGRLAAAYQLVRYGGRSLPDRERARTRSRLDRLRASLTR